MGARLRGIFILALASGMLTAASSGQSSGSAYQVDPTITGITVSGRVTYLGAFPKLQSIPVRRDSTFCGEIMPNESLMVDHETHGIEAVVISLEGIIKGKPLPEDQMLTVNNRTCRFAPRVSATTLGTFGIGNADPITHNTHVRKETRYGDNVVNVVLPAGVRTIRKSIRETGLLDVRCDAHAFMHGLIYAFDHPYFTVTDGLGRFELTHVPPGRYRLRARHETLGEQEQTIVVPAEGALTVNVEMSPEA